MTRETKIGLLVGLAFIIVIGILLSDYNRNEIQGAALPQVADNIRNSTATPHNGSSQDQVVPPPAPTAPARTVLTPQDLHQASAGETGPASTAAPSPAPGPTALAARTDEHPAVPPVISDNPLYEPAPQPSPREPSEPAGPTGIPGTEAVGPHHPAARESAAPAMPAAPTVNGARQYVAVAGDTLNKLAGRFMGGNTKPNRQAILAINPTLKANPNNVIVGRTYMIPAMKPAAVSAAPGSPANPAPVTAAPVAAAPAEAPHYFYTVKENDNLWRIASEQLGDGSAWAAIKELNKDVLKGGEGLRPNMRLRLPAKPVASTN